MVQFLFRSDPAERSFGLELLDLDVREGGHVFLCLSCQKRGNGARILQGIVCTLLNTEGDNGSSSVVAACPKVVDVLLLCVVIADASFCTDIDGVPLPPPPPASSLVPSAAPFTMVRTQSPQKNERSIRCTRCYRQQCENTPGRCSARKYDEAVIRLWNFIEAYHSGEQEPIGKLIHVAGRNRLDCR